MRRILLALLIAFALLVASVGVVYARGSSASGDPELPLAGCVYGEHGVLKAIGKGAPLSCPGR